MLFLWLSFEDSPCEQYWPQYYICNAEQCKINQSAVARCTVNSQIKCSGNRTLIKEVNCLYCWQLPDSDVHCYFGDKCTPQARPQPATCQALPDVQCLGERTFGQLRYCQSTSGISQITTLLLSLFFGGFGVDRFYLGYFKLGICKLLTFGGFGVWSFIDVVLICTDALRPADGSLYSTKISAI